MHPLRFWSLFFALAASATALFPRIAEGRPEGTRRRPVVRPPARTPIVKIGRPYIAEIHARSGSKPRVKK